MSKNVWKFKSRANKIITIIANVMALTMVVFFVSGVAFSIWVGMKAVWNLTLFWKGCQCAH